MAELDQAARYAARRLNAGAYLRELTGEAFWKVWRWRGWQDSQTIPFPGEPDRRLDTLAWFDRTDAASPPLALAVEFLAVGAHVGGNRELEIRRRALGRV